MRTVLAPAAASREDEAPPDQGNGEAEASQNQDAGRSAAALGGSDFKKWRLAPTHGVHLVVQQFIPQKKIPKGDPSAFRYRSGAYELQRRDVAGDKGPLLLDDGVIDRGAEAFVEDFDAEQFRRGGGAVLVGAGQGDVEGQSLVGIPGKSGFSPIFFIRARRRFLGFDPGRRM